MKKLIAATSLATLLAAPLAASAASFNVLSVTRSDRPSILSLEAADGAEAGLEWSTNGAAQLELLVRCGGRERLRVEAEDGAVTYVTCRGRLAAAYRGIVETDAAGGVSLAVTGDRQVKVDAILKLYDYAKGKKLKLIDSQKLSVKVAPEVRGE